MTTLGERPFHLVMAVLVLLSTGIDPAMRALLPAWRPPEVGLVTLALGLIWVALFAAHRGKGLDDRQRVLEDRVQRLERQLAALAESRRPG